MLLDEVGRIFSQKKDGKSTEGNLCKWSNGDIVTDQPDCFDGIVLIGIGGRCIVLKGLSKWLIGYNVTKRPVGLD